MIYVLLDSSGEQHLRDAAPTLIKIHVETRGRPSNRADREVLSSTVVVTARPDTIRAAEAAAMRRHRRRFENDEVLSLAVCLSPSAYNIGTVAQPAHRAQALALPAWRERRSEVLCMIINGMSRVQPERSQEFTRTAPNNPIASAFLSLSPRFRTYKSLTVTK